MLIKNLFNRIKSPCKKCPKRPYKSGQVETPFDPCALCKILKTYKQVEQQKFSP